MARLSLFLFGPPRVEHAGSPVEVGRRKALALLAYLAITGEPQSREALAALLWPESPASRAYAYLRNALWTLNQTPVEAWLEADRQTVNLRRRADLWLDVEQFRARLTACQTNAPHTAPLPLLAEAVDLYRGDFMAGFSPGDSAPFEAWQLFEAQALQSELAGALERLIHLYETQAQFEPATAYAQRWLSLDPLNESAQRHLMRLYARSGQRVAALRQYQACANTLKEELGLAPSQETVALYQRIRAGELGAVARQERPALPAHNLPPQPTPFVGRETELAEIQRLLADADCRLLTLVGLGGGGKTRLALQAASEWVDRLPDGVFFVPLAPVSSPEFVAPAVVDALRIPLPKQTVEALPAHLTDYLRPRRLLLILDNLEHLLPDVSLIEAILGSAPDVKLLVTSRQRLNLRGEWALDVAGLRFPKQEADPQTYENYGAVRLFLQSARQADVGFRPTADDVAAVARICRLVEGVPLGIEMAASWIKLLSPPEIAAEIETNLDFLTTSLRDLPERHRSLRAVFAQSWALLSKEGRACFRKLALFRGGFTRQAAGDVAGASLSALASLVDKSLLRRTPSGRYELHELLRQYAEERLLAVPRESDVVRDRHGRHYLELLSRLESALQGQGQKAALDTIDRELENVRLAWTWAVDRGEIGLMRQAALSLFLFYDIRSRFQEGASVFGRAVAARAPVAPAGPDDQALLGVLLAMQGWFLRFFAPTEARAAFRQSLVHLDPLGSQKELAFANVLFAFARMAESRSEALARLEQSLSFYRVRDDRWGVALALEAMGGVLCGHDNQAAETHVQQSLALRRQIGDQWGVALAQFMLGRVAETQSRLSAAQSHYGQSLQQRRELGEDMAGAVECLNSMGRVARRLGDYDQARQWHREGLALSREINHPWHTSNSLGELGLVALDREEYLQAKDYFERGLHLAESRGDDHQIALLHTDLSNVALALDELEVARRHLERSSQIEPHNPCILLGWGRLHLALDHSQAAEAGFCQALRRALEWGLGPLIPEILFHLARHRLERGRPERGVELLGVALNHPAFGHALRRQAERLLAKVDLPATDLKAALSRGRARDLDSLVDDLLASVEPPASRPL